MSPKTVKNKAKNTGMRGKATSAPVKKGIGEDWLALIISGGIILLSILGILGKNGINISF